jgi:hypothetical protein
MRGLLENPLILQKHHRLAITPPSMSQMAFVMLKMKDIQVISRYYMHHQGLSFSVQAYRIWSLILNLLNRPCYLGLMNNVSTPLMRTSLGAWPEGTQDFVNHQILEEYIISLCRSSGVSLVTQYNTRVEEVKKIGTTWAVRTLSLTRDSTFGRRRLVSKLWVRSLYSCFARK